MVPTENPELGSLVAHTTITSMHQTGVTFVTPNLLLMRGVRNEVMNLRLLLLLPVPLLSNKLPPPRNLTLSLN